MDTGKGLLTLQVFVFTNREDQPGPVPTSETSLWTTWKLRLQKSLVGKYHTVIPSSDLTLSSLCLHICKKGHGMAEHLSSEQLQACGLPSVLSCSFPALISGPFLSHSEPSQMPLPQSCDSGGATSVSWRALFIPRLSLTR